ncbi:hypothetical protein [Lentibacillus salicampi]|nr:hypothetical protein [Lentibacillus salicampi]
MSDVSTDEILQAIRELQNQMNGGFARVDKRFDQMDEKIDRVQEVWICW